MLRSPWLSGLVRGGYGDVQAGSPLDRACLTALIVIGILILTGRKLDWQSFNRNNIWLLAIYIFALVSILWSDFPFVSLKRYIRFAGTVVMALVILSELNPLQAMESILRRTVFVLIPYSLLLIKYFPNLGVMYSRWSGELMWVGVADHKNSAGMLFFASAFYLFWRVARAWKERRIQGITMQNYADGFVLVLSLYLLKGSDNAYSATSISAFALGASTMLGLLWLRGRGISLGLPTFTMIVLGLFIYGWGTPFGLRSLGSSILELLGRDPTFTSRDEIWEQLIPVAMQRPILGHGYGGFWVLPNEAMVNEAHNGYLDVMLVLGLVGVLLLLGFVLSMCKAAYAALDQDFWWGSFAMCFLLMIVLHNTSETSYLRTSDFLWSQFGVPKGINAHCRPG